MGALCSYCKKGKAVEEKEDAGSIDVIGDVKAAAADAVEAVTSDVIGDVKAAAAEAVMDAVTSSGSVGGGGSEQAASLAEASNALATAGASQATSAALATTTTTAAGATGQTSAKAKIAEALIKAAGEGAMKEAVLAAAQPGPLDVQKVYDAALEGASKGAKVFGASMGAKGVNVAILEASQYAAMVVLSEATKEAGRQTVYYGAGSVTQTALAGVAGIASAVNPTIWASIVGELSGKTVAWATDGDEEVAGIVGSVGAGALAGAYVGSSFGPAGTLAGLAGGAAVGTTQHLTSQLIVWFMDQAEDYIEEKFLSDDDDDKDGEAEAKEDGTSWKKTNLEKMTVDEQGLLKVKLPTPALDPLPGDSAPADIPAARVAAAADAMHKEERPPPMLLGGKLQGLAAKPFQRSDNEEPAQKTAPSAVAVVPTPGAIDV